jgi:hypothetical protein
MVFSAGEKCGVTMKMCSKRGVVKAARTFRLFLLNL